MDPSVGRRASVGIVRSNLSSLPARVLFQLLINWFSSSTDPTVRPMAPKPAPSRRLACSGSEPVKLTLLTNTVSGGPLEKLEIKPSFQPFNHIRPTQLSPL